MENHYFVTNDPVFIHYGAGNFSKETIEEHLTRMKDDGNNISDEEFYSELSGTLDLNLLFGGSSWTAKIFNSGTKKIENKTYTFAEIETLIDDFETEMEKLIKQPEDKDEIAKNKKEVNKWIKDNLSAIKAGPDKCIQLFGTIFYDKENDDPDSTIAYHTKLHFNLPFERSDERVVAQRGRTVLSDVARRPTGDMYSRSKSKAKNTGLYVSPDSRDGSQTPDLATGPIRLAYNEPLGMWESSQCILARLITDLGPASNQAFSLPEEEDDYLVDNDDAKKFYETESEFYSGKFTTGIAVPVNSQSRNPHLFGPNIKIDLDGRKIEKIRVVNRAEKSFTAGTLVMCTLIGSEWIVSEFSNPADGLNQRTKLGPWTFNKLIANADAFFRQENGGGFFNINDYEKAGRKSWYEGWKQASAGTSNLLDHHSGNTIYSDNIEHLPTTVPAFNPSNGYFSSTSFDSVDKYGPTNNVETVRQNHPNDGVETHGRDFGIFWGPIFPDGYTAKTASQGTNSYGISSAAYFHSTEVPALSEIPADIAVNGPYDDNTMSSPILPIDYFQKNIKNNGLYTAAKRYKGTTVTNPTYIEGFGYQPTNPNRLQLTALPAEAVIGAGLDQFGTSQKGTFLQKVYDYAQEIAPDHKFGNMSARHEGKIVKYDDLLTYTPLTTGDGSLYPLNEFDNKTGLGVVGITSAINKLRKPGGGTINFDVEQLFGLPSYTTSTVQQGSAASIIGGFVISMGGGGGAVNTICRQQWGSVTDNYNVFGTTALHARVYDGWPHEDTIWDTRYFTALHFNPELPDEDGETSVDFGVPTIEDGTEFGKVAAVGTNPNTVQFKSRGDWIKDTVRRGMLLTNGGFVYRKLTLRMNLQNAIIAKAGTTAVDGSKESASNNYKLFFTTVDGAVALVTADVDEFGQQMLGEDFSASSFSGTYTDEGGTEHTGLIINYADAVIVIPGTVDTIKKRDEAPKQHGGITRLTSPSDPISDRGCNSDKITGNKTSELSLDTNDSGEYDLFLFFHNDISHTFIDTHHFVMVGDPQYVNITIS